MSPKPITGTMDMPLTAIVQLMIKNSVGSVIILDREGGPLCLVTERELLREIVTQGEIPKRVKAREIIKSKVVEVEPETSLEDAAKIMIRKKARLVVTDGIQVVGMVSASDLVRGYSSEISWERYISQDTITSKVRTLDLDRTVFDALKLMHEKRIGSVVITKDEEPYGIFTERDLLTKILRLKKKLDTKLRYVASRPLIRLEGIIPVQHLATIMTSNKIKRLPLMKEGKLSAIVTSRDLLEAFSTSIT